MTLKQDGTISHSMESTGNNGCVRDVKKVERNISYITALQNVSDLRERERERKVHIRLLPFILFFFAFYSF